MSPPPAEAVLPEAAAMGAASWLPRQPKRQVLWLGPQHAAERFADWCATHPGSRCDLLLSAQLVHSLLLGDAAQPLRVLQAQARAHWARFHGAAALGWPVAVGDAAGAAIACAPDGFDLAELRATARRHRVGLRSIQPAWAAAWAAAVKPRESVRLAVFEPGAVMWLAVDAGRCVALARQAVDEADLHDHARLVALLKQAPLPAGHAPWRLAGHGAAAVAEAGSAASQLRPARDGRWVPLPDFAADAARAAWPAWALLGGAAAVLAASALDSSAWAERVAAQHERVAAVERAANARRPSALPAPSQPLRADDDAAARAAQRITARLQHPWPQLFAALEGAAGERVRLLSIGHDSGSGALRVEGIAADADALSAWVNALAASPALRDVVLRSQQAPRDAAAAPGLRFDISAVLR